MANKKFKIGEAIVFDPKWWDRNWEGKHPINKDELVYFISYIPNVPGHCIVARWTGQVVPMVHPEDFRKAKDRDL